MFTTLVCGVRGGAVGGFLAVRPHRLDSHFQNVVGPLVAILDVPQSLTVIAIDGLDDTYVFALNCTRIWPRSLPSSMPISRLIAGSCRRYEAAANMSRPLAMKPLGSVNAGSNNARASRAEAPAR